MLQAVGVWTSVRVFQRGVPDGGCTMKHAINLPAIGNLADPLALIEIAQAADENGWDGLFLWDNLFFEHNGVPIPALDPWLLLGCVAIRTRRIRLGPMVTPIPSRRIGQLARSTATLDVLSDGRLILGCGLGGDSLGELSAFGETPMGRKRGDMLDDGLAALRELWSSDAVTFRRPHLRIENVSMRPKPVQKPSVPIWLGTRGAARPVRRAARYDGIFPIDVTPDDLARILDQIRGIRGSLDGFDVAVAVTPKLHLSHFSQQGVTWAMHSFWHTHQPAQVLRVVGKPPPQD